MELPPKRIDWPPPELWLLNRVLERTGGLGHSWRAKYGNFSRVPKVLVVEAKRSTSGVLNHGCIAQNSALYYGSFAGRKAY